MSRAGPGVVPSASGTLLHLSTTGVAPGVPGVEARGVGDAVVPSADRQTGWPARQTLELRGMDGAAQPVLVGRLEGQESAAASLDWQPSLALPQQAHDGAATAALGLHVDHVGDVDGDFR